MWELDHNKCWVPKNRSFWIVVLEKTLESPLDCGEIKPVNCRGNQSWIFIGRTGAEAEAPVVWPPDAKNWLVGRPWCWNDWRQEEKGTTEDETVGWHHWHDGHEFEQTPGVRDGQGRLGCCSPWGHKELDLTEWLNSDIVFPESPLNSKEIKPVNPKRNQPWIFNGRTDAEAEVLILWLPDVKNQLIGKTPDAGKDWRQKGEGGGREWNG